MRRTQRLFALAEHLRARRSGVTAEQLAQRFGVSLRTIYRDLDALKVAHLPVRADRGRGGGYALDRSYALPPVNFTAREAAVLLTAGAFLERARVMPFTEALASALDKVRNALSPEARRELAALGETLQFAVIPSHTGTPPVRRAIEQAFFERQPVELAYTDRDGVRTRRVVELLSVLIDRGETLLNVRDHSRGGDTRQLKLHRIESARVVRRPPREPGSP